MYLESMSGAVMYNRHDEEEGCDYLPFIFMLYLYDYLYSFGSELMSVVSVDENQTYVWEIVQ